MNNTITGSCHCGSVEFELQASPKLVVNCHCNDCRKRNGSAFSSYLAVAENALNITKGQSSIKQYTIEDVGTKYFCDTCGSPVYNQNLRYPGMYMLFYGAFPDAGRFTPSVNVYCESKLGWVDDISNIASFPGPIKG